MRTLVGEGKIAAPVTAAALAISLGFTAAVLGERKASASEAAAARTVGSAAMGSESNGNEQTIPGLVQAPDGRWAKAINNPYGNVVTAKFASGSIVEIICQAPGQSAPGKPNGPSLNDITWYRIWPQNGYGNTEEWLPRNFVQPSAPPPSCPPSNQQYPGNIPQPSPSPITPTPNQNLTPYPGLTPNPPYGGS